MVLVVVLLFGVASAHAQDRSPYTGPRLEVAGGVLLLPTALTTTFAIGFLAGPGIFSCGLFNDDTAEDRKCEKERRRDQQNAWITGGVVGSLVGAVGIGLIVHGALRLRDVRRAERERFTVMPAQLSPHGYGLLAAGRF